MIEGLVAGTIWGEPEKRLGKNDSLFVVAKVRAQGTQPELTIVNVIAFDHAACKALLQLQDGAAVSLSGSLLPKVWVDKQGVSRAALDMIASRVLAWNGAAEVRARSRDPRPIAVDDHARWFAARLRAPRGGLWIAVLGGCPVGVVRIDREADDASALGRISIVLDSSVRGRGLGRRVIALACAADGGPVVAEILVDNRTSRACFEAAGFTREPSSTPPLTIDGGDPRPVIRYLWRPDRVHDR